MTTSTDHPQCRLVILDGGRMVLERELVAMLWTPGPLPTNRLAELLARLERRQATLMVVPASPE